MNREKMEIESSIRPYGPINDGFNVKKANQRNAVDLINEKQRHLIFLMKCATTHLLEEKGEEITF